MILYSKLQTILLLLNDPGITPGSFRLFAFPTNPAGSVRGLESSLLVLASPL